MTTTESQFDFMAHRDRHQQATYAAIRDLTYPQQIQYYRAAIAQSPLAAWWQKLQS